MGVRRSLVLTQSLKTWGAQHAVLGALREPDSGDEVGFHPGRRSVKGRLINKRVFLNLHGFQLRSNLIQRLVIESRAHVAGVFQVPVMILSNYQRPECIGSVTGSLRVASDDEIVLARLLDLQPAPRAAPRFIDAVRTLRDDPLHAEIERSLVGVL